MEGNVLKEINIKKTMTELRRSLEGSVHTPFDEYQDYRHSTTTMYSNSYDGDDEVFLSEETEKILVARKPRPRCTSGDVIDSLGDGSPPKDLSHFPFHSDTDRSSDYSSNFNLQASSRTAAKAKSQYWPGPQGGQLKEKFLSPPPTPGSDVGYFSGGLPTPPSKMNWPRIGSPASIDSAIKWEDQMDNFKWDDTDAKPTNAEEISLNHSYCSWAKKVEVKMPVARDSPEYNMNHVKRGIAVIFNNENFNSIQARKGSNVDVDSLENILKSLEFSVVTYNDLDFHQIRNVITDLVMTDYTDCDCLLVAVLTHGKINNFLHARDVLYPAEYLWKDFIPDKCPTLAGKPKIFFVQACKGEGFDNGAKLVNTSQTDSGSDSYTIPAKADFLIAYSTVEGYYSWRNPENGTWFIQSLCQVLNENYKTMDLLKMLTVVSRRVAIEYESFNELISEQNGKKQVPSISSTLIRDVYFRPK